MAKKSSRTRRPAKRSAAKTGAKRHTAAKRTAKKPTVKKRTVKKTRGTAVRGVVAGAIAAVADRMPWASGEPDAIRLLETDHRRLEDLLKQGEDTTAGAAQKRTALLDSITSELNVHELIEEKVLYPALKVHPEAKDIVLEGYQEHHVADLIVQELHSLSKDDERWGAKFKVLQESLQHHIEEEEGEMFRTARAVMSREELQELGARMAEMKAQAKAPTKS